MQMETCIQSESNCWTIALSISRLEGFFEDWCYVKFEGKKKISGLSLSNFSAAFYILYQRLLQLIDLVYVVFDDKA